MTFRSASRITRMRQLWLMVVVLLVAAALRLTSIGHVPPGLYHDEAYNGLDALKVLDGDWPLYFSANNGREPMFIYLMALSVGLLGRSPFAVRLTAVGPGMLTVAATYALTRTLLGRRVALLSAAVLSVTLWHIHLSRVGFRAVLLPLFISLTLWQGALGWRTGRRRYWLAAGVLYGLSFYTYIAARFTLVAWSVFGVYLLCTHPELRKRDRLAPLAWSGLAAIVTLAPLALFTIMNPDVVQSRMGQVSIWNPEIHAGDFWGTLLRHAARTAGMFFVRGDRIWRHNLPWRPVFDPLLGAFFLIGLVRALRLFRHRAVLALIVIWTGTMMLPTLLAEDAPHFLRGVGVLPLAALFPALGLDWLLSVAKRAHFNFQYPIPNGQYVLGVIPASALLLALISSTVAYFRDYARADMTAYWFEDGAVKLAGQINGFLGVGWNGKKMLHRSTSLQQSGTSDTSARDRSVHVEPALWESWTSVPFLIADSPAVHLLPTDLAWPTVDDGPSAIFVWPYGNWQRVWSMLSAPAEIRVQEGPLSQGDRDAEPFTTFVGFFVTPVGDASAPLARFQGGVQLVGASVRPVDQGVSVELFWQATARLSDDYKVFVHYLRDGLRVAQDDAQPAGGRYPTSRWQTGDLIHDDHLIAFSDPLDTDSDQVVVGLYHSEDGQHLNLLDQAGNAAGPSFTLTVGEILQ